MTAAQRIARALGCRPAPAREIDQRLERIAAETTTGEERAR